MRILFDQGTPVPLRRHLPDHSIATAFEKCWSDLVNGMRSASWPRIQKSVSAIQAAVNRATVGSYEEIEIPDAD